MSTLGDRFAEAVAAKDFDRVASLFAPTIDFQAMTPGRSWTASTAQELVVSNPDGRFLIEQRAYYDVADGTVNWMRVLCSGWRPLGG